MKYNNDLYLKHKEFINDLFTNYFEKIETHYEFFESNLSEVEYKPYDGFIPYTNGGIEICNFSNVNYLISTGKINNDKLQKFINDKSIEFYQEHNIYNYTNDPLDIENCDSIASTLEDISIMFCLGIYFYDIKNIHNKFKENSTYIFGYINWEAPYHRNIDKYQFYKSDYFIIDKDFNNKVKKSINEIIESLL